MESGEASKQTGATARPRSSPSRLARRKLEKPTQPGQKANGESKRGARRSAPKVSGPSIDGLIWNIVSAGQPEPIARAAFRQLTIDQSDIVGACHVVRNNEGLWDIDPANATGRVPRFTDFGPQLATTCDSAVARQSTQMYQLGESANMQVILVPVLCFGARPEVLLAVMPGKANIGQVIPKLGSIANGLQFWRKSNQAGKADWKLNSLSTLVEMVSKIENAEHHTAAAELIANELSRHLSCNVAVGIRYGGRQKLVAVSGITKIKKSTRRVWAFQQVVHEAQLKEDGGVYPVDGKADDTLLLAHKQLASHLQVDSVRSKILETADNEVVGSLVFAGESPLIQSERLKKFLDASAPRIASALSVTRRAERSWPMRFLYQIPSWIKKAKILFGIAAVIGLVLLMCCEFTYRVRCQCVIQPVERRFAVAPFDGLVHKTHVEPGDHVRAGQVLASMDGRSIRWELAGVVAEREQARKTHEIELANRNVSEAMLAQLEDQRLASQLKDLNFKEASLEIRSPVDGILLSGSAENNNASSVSTGDMLFEVAPIDSLKVEVGIPAEDIAHIEEGMEMQVWIDGFESKPLMGKVNRIYPRSEIRDATNVFVAEFLIDNTNLEFRPGMKGVARIDSHPHPLAWNLFHKPWDYLVANWLN